MEPADWVAAALAALAESGETAVAVEPLSRRLGVTKGSFYWHFSGKDALWEALLAAFERDGTGAPIARLSGVAARERLLGIVAVAWERVDHLRAERALLASARADVRAVLVRVHARRRAFMVDAYRDLGMSEEDAELFATTAYAAFVGAVMLSDQEPFRSEGALRAYAAQVGRVLVPDVQEA